MVDSPSFKDTKEGASAVTAGREFHKGYVRGKKLNLKQSVEGENCLNFLVCDYLVIAVDRVKYNDRGMSTSRGPLYKKG